MVGKKAVMGVTGLIGIGFVILHSLGNPSAAAHELGFTAETTVSDGLADLFAESNLPAAR